MRDKLHLDFETYSEANIRVVGGMRYAEDPTTEILITGWCFGDEEPVTVDMTTADAMSQLAPLFERIDNGAPIGAHNAHFERAVWELAGRFPIVPKAAQWDCTAARARMIAIPGSLEGAAHALGVKLRKDEAGDDLIKIFSKPDKKKGRCMPSDRPEDFLRFREYCAQDVRVERELDKILPALSDVEHAAFQLDYKINRTGLPVNMGRVEAADGFVDDYSNELLRRSVEISGYKPTQRERTLEYLESRGFLIPNLQAATVEALAARPDLPDDLRELLNHRIEVSRAGTKKLKAIRDCVSPDGRIRGGFLFSAASTRRWSSTGVQVHNLQKPEGECDPDLALSLLDDDPYDLCLMFNRPLTVLAQSIRGFFESQEHFLIADYASIEPRGLAWIAGEEWLLEAYRKKQDAYKIAAGRVYGINPAKIAKDSRERFVGKQIILGCGYGMGPDRFIETCATKAFPPLVLTQEEATKAVYGYRDSVPEIKALWRKLNSACIKATRTWKEVALGRLTIRPATLSNGFQLIYVDMPSGSIAYPKPSLGTEIWNGEEMSTFNFYTPLGSSWIKTDTFGGSLVENVIQALTRDVLRDGLLASDRAGFKLVGHVHDEAIAEGANSKSDLAEFERLLCHSSDWAEGFPIETEGFISKVYKK